MNKQVYEKIIDSICYENKQKYKLFIYSKDNISNDKSIILINHLNKKFSQIIDFYDISDYISKDNNINEIIILKDFKNNTVLISQQIEIEIVEKYFMGNLCLRY